MATIQPTITDVSGDGTALLFVWVLGNADDGAPISDQYIQLSDCCVDAIGTFGGATVVFEGSNGGVTYGTLNNVQGTTISAVAALPPKQVAEVPRFRRPRTSGGTGTAITFGALCRRQQPART